MSQEKEREALLLQTVEALRNYVDVIAKAGGGDKMLFMAAMREADDKARAALAAIGPQDFGDLTGVQPCCGDYVNCHRACTPRGRWQATKDREDALASQQAVKGEPVAFLANGTRFKMAFHDNADDLGNLTGGTHVTCFSNFAKELDGRWVALVAAEDDQHLRLQQPALASPPSREPLTPESWEEIEAVIACLGDDAAQLRGENPEDERAANMDRAADLLAFAYGIHSREGGSNG